MGRACALVLWFAAVTALAQSESTPEPVQFSNGDVVLAGTIIRPAKLDSFPGVVFIHGSGPHSREGPLSYAETFTKAGVGVLAFDKRGSGESTGSWVNASLNDLADDVAAAVAFLRRQPGFDPDRIGLWGVSQGGWIGPMVASEDERIAFLIVVSGGGASPLQSELYSYRNAFGRAGLSAELRAEALTVLGQYFRYLGSGENRDALVARLEWARTRPWYDSVNLHRVLPSEKNRHNWEWVANWDPLLSIAGVHCPVLLVFGDHDRQQPTELALTRWREGLGLAGNNQFDVRVFEGADHGIRVVTGTDGGGHGRGPFADGYPAVMGHWLKTMLEPESP